MNHSEAVKVIRHFLKNGCKGLNFEKCEEYHKEYTKATKKPGCSACAKRRARNTYGGMVKEVLKDLDYKDVFPEGD
tara:strand:+ start:431 stop:658 length:228 start_codon:yes stop_codon:yes gene_type:complete